LEKVMKFAWNVLAVLAITSAVLFGCSSSNGESADAVSTPAEESAAAVAANREATESKYESKSVAPPKPAQAVVDDQVASRDDGGFSPFVDAAGNISRPVDYMTKWVHLGDWAVADDEESILEAARCCPTDAIQVVDVDTGQVLYPEE
jgi:hypothetical protein